MQRIPVESLPPWGESLRSDSLRFNRAITFIKLHMPSVLSCTFILHIHGTVKPRSLNGLQNLPLSLISLHLLVLTFSRTRKGCWHHLLPCRDHRQQKSVLAGLPKPELASRAGAKQSNWSPDITLRKGLLCLFQMGFVLRVYLQGGD